MHLCAAQANLLAYMEARLLGNNETANMFINCLELAELLVSSADACDSSGQILLICFSPTVSHHILPSHSCCCSVDLHRGPESRHQYGCICCRI